LVCHLKNLLFLTSENEAILFHREFFPKCGDAIFDHQLSSREFVEVRRNNITMITEKVQTSARNVIILLTIVKRIERSRYVRNFNLQVI